MTRHIIVTGATSPLGSLIVRRLHGRGDHVIAVGRDADRLAAAVNPEVRTVVADLSTPDGAADVVAKTDRVDALVNVVGASDRGLIEELTDDEALRLFDTNVLTTLRMCRAAAGPLKSSRGVVVNIGSIAGKVGARYIGGYAIAKHGLAGLTQQLRLEWREHGVHVGTVSPGPIRRDDAGRRYADRMTATEAPDVASAPGGGTKLRGLDPERVVDAVARILDRRTPDIILPGYLRYLIAAGHLSPRLGDWLLLRFSR